MGKDLALTHGSLFDKVFPFRKAFIEDPAITHWLTAEWEPWELL